MVALMLGLLTFQVEGQVLCVGEDGHFSVESALWGNCAPQEAHGHSALEGTSLENSHCGVCTDTLLEEPNAAQRKLPEPAPPTSLAVWPLSCNLLDTRPTTEIRFRFQQPMDATASVIHRRTVVLLI